MAEGPVNALGAQQIATHEKHEAEGKPAFQQVRAEFAQNAQIPVPLAGGVVAQHHESPMKLYGVDPRDKEIAQKLILAQYAQPGGPLPQMISDNKDVAAWIADKTKIAEADQLINNLLTFYDQTSLAEKREFDRKFPWIKEMKLKRIREVAAMHLRLAELCENSDPSFDDVKYIIDLLQGKAKLPPALLPTPIHNNLEPRGVQSGGQRFIEGMFNPFKFTNPIDTTRKNAVVQALGTNVLGKGFMERWGNGSTSQGPQTMEEWTDYWINKALGANPAYPFGATNQRF